jgi:hypothetical protein
MYRQAVFLAAQPHSSLKAPEAPIPGCRGPNEPCSKPFPKGAFATRISASIGANTASRSAKSDFGASGSFPSRPPFSTRGHASGPNRRPSALRRSVTRGLSPGKTLAVLLSFDGPTQVMQKIVILEAAVMPRYLAWLSYENASGANIYITANPLRSAGRKGTEENIASVRYLYIDIDEDGVTRLAKPRRKSCSRTPTGRKGVVDGDALG